MQYENEILAVCPICGKLNWCHYLCEIRSGLMVVYLCCDECEEKEHSKPTRKVS